MKKFLAIFCAVLLMVSMTACGSKEKSTENQEKVVKDFFSYFEKGDMDSIEKITTKSGYHQVEVLHTALEGGMEEFEDTTQYGDTTSSAAKDYMEYTFTKIFKDIEIESAEYKDEKTVVIVKGQQIDSSDFSTQLTSINYEQMMTDFTNVEENKTKMQEIYNAQGENEAVKWLVDQIAPELFGKIKALIDECPYIAFNGSFTLIQEKDTWLIDSIY